MSDVSSIGASAASYYSQLASGSKLQSAADGAAELTIVEEENAQVTGLEVGASNAASAQDMLNVSDSALANITDSLQRIRELAVAASNSALLSGSDLQAYQDEIDQLKQGISDIASQTTYNTQNIIDGSNTEYNLATDANGGYTTVNTTDATLEALGIADFDVTGDFDIQTIDDAISYVSSARSSGGAQSNALEYLQNSNYYTAENLTAASSRLEDTDYPQAVEELKKKQAQMAYAYIMQKHQQDQEAQSSGRFFAQL